MKKNGFTMVELLVAISLFLVVVSIATGTFIQALRTQRAAVFLIAAVSNAGLAVEQISREIRTGQNFSLSGGELSFLNAKNENVTYALRNGAIEKTLNGRPGRITADNVQVTRLDFVLAGNDPGDDLPSKITVILEISAPQASAASKINLQITVSSRILNG